MTDFRLMRGEGWVRCCICGKLHEAPYPDLARDPEDDALTDVCRGECARETGLSNDDESFIDYNFIRRGPYRGPYIKPSSDA